MLCRRTVPLVPLAVLSLPLDRSPIQGLPELQFDALPVHCSTGGIELTTGQIPYTRIIWAPTVVCPAGALFHLAVLSLPLDRSHTQVLPGLQQLDALPAHCSTGGIELTAGQVPNTVLPGLQQLDALPAHCSTGGIELTAGQGAYTSVTWAPTVGCSAGAMFHWRY
jgi:hypothetical protein